MTSQNYVPIGEDWDISIPIVESRTNAPIPTLTVTATLKTESGAIVNVPGQGDATTTLTFDAVTQEYVGMIAGLRLTGLTPPNAVGQETFYNLWLTEPVAKVNRRIRLPARYHARGP